MALIEVNLELPIDLDDRIQNLAKWRNMSWSQIGVKAIKSAYFVKNQWDAQRIIYQADKILIIPQPQESLYPPMNSMRLSMAPQIQTFLKKVCSGFELKEHSVIEWGLECMIIFEDAMLLNNVYARRPGEKQIVPCDINR